MARYVCEEEGRRRAVRGSALNGIDFVEVAEDQLGLEVHFLNDPAPELALANVAVEGGERVTGIRIVALENDAEVVIVTVDRPGDFSRYRLRLENVDGLDPRLSSIAFSFKVACPTDADCAATLPCPPQEAPAPDIDYLARDYASFRRLMLDRLSLLVPDWRERSPADLGIALVETLAYVGDHLSYALDAAGTEAYLETARRRISVRRHARLRDYFMHEGANARAFVHLRVEAGSGADGALLPGPSSETRQPGTRLLTRIADNLTVVPAIQIGDALRAGALVFESLHDLTLHAAHDDIPFHTWSDERCCLPAGATEATLRGPLPDLAAGDLLLLEEVRHPGTGSGADADIRRRHVVRLTRVEAGIDPLDDTPIVDIAWASADALPFPLCLSSVDAEGLPIADVSLAQGNLLLADQGHSLDETLRFEEQGEALVAEQVGLIHAVPLPSDHRARPAHDLRASDPRQATPQIRLFDGDLSWDTRRDLLASDAADRQFVAEVDEGGRAHLRFGDHEQGLVPEPGTVFTAEYRAGVGAEGNVGAGAIAHVVDAPEGIASVRNPLPAWGGSAPESLDQVRAHAPHAFKTQERAVTPDDYARIAEQHPEVQRAAATLQGTGAWDTVHLSIDRRGGLPVTEDEAFTASLLEHMDRFRMVGHDLEVQPPRFVPLDVVIRVCVGPDHLRSVIRSELQKRLGTGHLVDGRPAFFHPDRWTFGQSLYLSQLYADVMAVEGVDSARVTRLRRLGHDSNQALSSGELSIDPLEVLRLDNDPNFRERGRLQLDLEGGR
jgi:hypothetical protein